MITVIATARRISCMSDDLITSGSIGILVEFDLSEDFDGLQCMAVFQGSGTQREVVLTSDRTCDVPPEVVAKSGGYLRIGVYARNTSGTDAIPTVWVNVDRIQPGAIPDGVTPSAPTPDWTAQVQEIAAEALANSETAMEAVESVADSVAAAAASATAAASSASGAAQSATAASGSATSASGSATAAATSAGAAADSATAASAAQAAAETAQGGAEDAQDAAEAAQAAAEAVLASIPADYSELSADVVDLKSQIVYAGDKMDVIDGCKSIYPSDFRVGNIVISASGWSYKDSDYRVSTRPDVTYHLNAGDVISLSSYSSARMYIGWRKDSDDTYDVSGWKTSDFVVTEPGHYVINIDSVPNTVQSSVNNLFSLLSIKLANVDSVLSRVSELEKVEENVVEVGTNLVYSVDWKPSVISDKKIVNLNLTTTGVELTAIIAGAYRSAYCDIDVTEANAVTISYDTITPSTAKVRYGKQVGTTTTWLNYVNGTAVVDTTDIDTLRVTLYINQGTSVDAGTTAVFTHLQIEFGSLKTPYTNLRYTAIDAKARGDLSSIANEVTGTGNHAYYGDKITIDETTTGHLCNAELWKDFNSSGIADYNFTEHQSMTIYNDFMFLFQAADGACTILDMGTKDIVSTAVLSPTTKNHQNSAQFTDIYFEANDEFPLLAISRCGNSNTVSGTTDPALDCVNFYRVQRSDAIFTFTLVNKVVFNKNTYGSSWGIDVNSKQLFVVYLAHGNWSVRTDNPLTYSVFPMPPKSAILSGETITYEETDEIGHYETDYMSFQAMIVHNGLAFTGVNNLDIPSISRNQLWIVDVLKGRVKSKMPLSMFYGFEIEGVAIHSNSLFLTARAGGDASYPLKIWKYDF